MAENEISPSCEYMHIHSDLVDKVNENMPDDDILCDLAELYRVFGDSTRIRILYALFESEMCVCDIAQVLGMSISAISHQLRVLKQARLVKYRREGKTVRKTFELEDLDCANCAAKMENAVRGIEGVTFVSVSFMTQKMILEADDDKFNDIVKKAVKVCRKIEPDCTVIVK